MRTRTFKKVLAGSLAATLTFSMLPLCACAAASKSATSTAKLQRASVHDPSIIKDPKSGTYYALGSHTAAAKSTDLMNWTQLSTDYQNPSKEPFFGDLKTTLAKSFEWAGYHDGDAASGYAVWAPDAIYNPNYDWGDGKSKGAYMLYYCTSSTWRRSCIGYLVSKTINGTYQYKDTIVYSGFTKTGATDGNSTRNTKWNNHYLNLNKLIAQGSHKGGIDSIQDDKCFNSDGSWNNLYAPNAIDPTVFFDKTGKKMYMVYGSWSGGLFILEIDPATGEAKYPGVDTKDSASGNDADRYFGIHIAGGNHQSGEGPYILYDRATDYYYLYESYGGLSATGGYNMRLFRSKNVTGPYLDAAGRNAASSRADPYKYGIKVMGNYKFYNQQGKRSAGGNSAMIDTNGSMYLVYHQRFDSTPISENHELRVHQQFINADNWPVTAVYENRNEQITNYSTNDVVGTYEFINHGTAGADGTMLQSQLVALHQNGYVTGSLTGTWKKSNSGKGYDYLTLTLGTQTYKGVFYKQYDEGTSPQSKMTFTAIGNDNTSVWGSMVDTSSNKVMANLTAESLANQVPSTTVESFTLPKSFMDATITWTSSNQKVISPTGRVTLPAKDTSVQLTAVVQYKNVKVNKTFTVRVAHSAKLIYSYDFNAPADQGNALTPARGSAKAEKAVLQGTASIVSDSAKGRVLKIQNEKGSKGKNYLKLPSNTLSTVTSDGYSVSMWVNVSSDTWEHSALFEADLAGKTADGYPMTRIGANLIGRINANAYSDVQGNLLTTNGYRNQWEKVVYTVNSNGIKVYLNGKLVGKEQKDIGKCFDKTSTYGIQKAANVAVGSGDIWGDEDVRNAKFDNIQIYDGVLQDTEVATTYSHDIGMPVTTEVTLNDGTVKGITPSDTLKIAVSSTFTVNFASGQKLSQLQFNTGNGKSIQTGTFQKWNGTNGRYSLYASGKAGQATGIYVNGKRLFQVKIVN